ncbi:hypothetical protein ElyMa_000686700 [Elysia marginata]|uniref:Uncharacterized protein n=1 Tax=Elysia marginata TaxID=1093978 RepID=A0AAV4GJA1_9GAST|nr:hypothetical protein ElyMa_000686700 [Elysia marginata]
MCFSYYTILGKTPLDTGRKPGTLGGGGWFCVGPATHHVKKSARETPTNSPSQQVLDGTPATRANMPFMKVKGQTRKEAYDPTQSMTSFSHQVRLSAWNAQAMFDQADSPTHLGNAKV